jgi:hypothetical protein
MKYRDIINYYDLHYAVRNKIITIMEAMEIEEERVLLADQDLTEEDIDWFYGHGCFSEEVQRELDIKYYKMGVVNGADWIDT